MYKALLTLSLLLVAVSALADDTIIVQEAVVLDSDLSKFDNVEVVAVDSIVLEPGFKCSANSPSTFLLVDPFTTDDPDLTMTEGTNVEPSGTLDGGYLVGTINGQQGISPCGAATYQIPIEVPKGNKGMIPKLSIGYNSQAGDGLLGRGWNLGGISSIIATGKTRYYDNQSMPISSSDTACRVMWEGQRLLALNNAGLEADSFRTEEASHVKITTDGSGNSMWFTVKTPDGLTMEYGNTTDSKLALDASTQWKWMLNKVCDRNGNTIAYTYSKDESTGEVLLSEIEYGGTTASPVNSIVLHYQTRTDIGYAYIHDDLVLRDQLLDSISLHSNNVYFGSYSFQFDNQSGETLLKEIIRYDKDNNRFNATKISWESPTFDITQTAQNQTIESGSAYYQFTGDFTGDGIDDLVACELNPTTDTYTYDLYKGSSTGLPSTADESGNLPRSFTNEYWEAHELEFNANCANTAANTFGREDISYVFSGDFDGDGIDELLVKVMEWEELSNYLPGDLNDGFTAGFLTDFGGFYNDICNYSTDMESPGGMLLNYGIGHFIHFDKTLYSGEREHTIRLGESMLHKEQYSQFPDIDGRGYNSFPDNNSLVYYDPVNDTAIAYCTVTGEQRWGNFNGDGKADYIDPADNTFSVYTYNPTTNSYSSHSEDGYFLGTIDLNGDGITAWVALGDEGFETVSYATAWAECSGCNITDNDDWNGFLDEYDIESEYSLYVIQHCNDIDDQDCREDFLDSGNLTRSIGFELFMDHYTGRGPEVSLGYYLGTHSAASPLLTRAIEADIDTDGKNDLLIFSGNLLKTIYYDFEPSYSGGNITYSFSDTTKYLGLDDNIHLGDFNGDGITEMIFPNSDKSLCFITAGKPGIRVSAIRNGLGVESRFNYSPLTDSDVYTKEYDAEFPVIDFSSPWYVVSSVAQDNGVADSLYLEYEYEGAKIHVQGKGFLGFMKTTVVNDLLNISRITSLDYEDVFFQSYPLSTQSKVGQTSVSTSTNYITVDSIDVFKYRIQSDSVKIQDFLKGTTAITSFQYNSDGLMVEKQSQVGSLVTITENYTYTSAGWHVANKPEYTTTTYSRSGSTETDSSYMSYSSSTGNLIEKKDYLHTDRELSAKFSYDSFGNATRQSLTGKRGQNLTMDSIVTTMTYTDDGRFLATNSAPLNHTESYSWDLSTGMPSSKTAVNQTTSTIEYGPFLRSKKTTDANRIEASSAIRWTADRSENDSIAGALYYSWEEVSGTPEVVTYCDEVGRALRTVTRGFNDDELIFTDTEYNAKGQVYRQSLPYFSTDSPIWTTFTYDTYGRAATKTSSDAVVTTYSYSGLETTVNVTSDSDTTESRTELNTLGEIIESEDYLGNIVSYYYFPDGKLKETRVNSHSSDITSFTYDAQGNQIFITDPDAGTTTSLYDAFGQLLRQINSKNDTVSFTYDAIGRVTTKGDARGTTNYSYISDNSSPAFGMVDSVYNSNLSLKEVFTYSTDYGRLLTQTKASADKTFTNSFSYDWYGRPLSRTYPSGFEVQYSYTDNGDLEQVTAEGITLWSCTDANALGLITSYSQGSYSTSVNYNTIGRLSQVTTGSIFDWKYNFDDLGNLSSREDVENDQKEIYSYDKLNRLTKIELYENQGTTHISSADISMAYDDCGNITSKTNLSSEMDYGEGTAGPHALTTINNPDATYTPPPQVISYNCFNKVSSITDTINGGTPLNISFDYGLSNQRIKTTTTRNSTIERVKHFNGDYEEDSTASGVKKYHYIQGGTGLTAIFVKRGTGNDTMYHVLSDHLGSLTSIVNATSDQVQSFNYNAWGIPTEADDWTTENTGELFAGRGFTGHEHLTEFNLINMNGRIYDPVVGRFLSPDPIVQSPQYPNNYNRYSYALNNPLRFTDPSGYYNKPSPLERERANGEVTYYNYELAYKMAGLAGSQFGSLRDKSSSGGWTYDKSAGTYSNRFTGETMTAGEFANYSQDASWVTSNLNVGWADYSSWAIFETGTSLDLGRTFVGNGNFGVVQIGSVIPTNNNVIFTSRGSADYFLNHRDPWFTLDPNDKIVASVGLFGTWLTSNKGTFRIRKSGRLSLRYYSSGWRTGNQYVNKLYSVSKVGSGVSLGADVALSLNAYNDIISGQARTLTYVDVVLGPAGVANSTSTLLFGYSIPVVGEITALYGIFRLTWDVFYDLGTRYGPSTWF